ncbi:MTC tricarboxylate transporter [Schizosaccharomyces japonicus yFS275]|uniref:Sidoreflexin n=1 Tax=Schizosaccharomyces japonicus (strain yFS275 / FY16936) TaxID=402676 RepID=B6K782_SCHJY|nr:MTC tricarboxylate transporter [Schizosaccharomyces japonicus yFS275]EEB09386.1 MTC tricarboxylate transporter [Schizosaccharomyces japonicus yFS275]
MPENQLPSSRYDLNTYWGRVRHAMEITDPRTLLTTKKDLANAVAVLDAFKTGKNPKLDESVWHAKKIVDSTLHPDTKQPVFLPFRMSCFVLTNLVVTAGMLQPNLGTLGTAFWQWTNQSVNVAFNSANANKSSPLSLSQTAKSYAYAVSASCGVAIGLNKLVPRLKFLSASAKTVLGRLTPFAAVASAGALNVFLMRGEELRRGIDVYDAEGNSLSKSKKAAFYAVGETALSRVFNCSPIMVLPPLALMAFQKQNWLRTRPGLTIPVNLALIFATSIVALPLAIGVFPARESVSPHKLEPEFHHLKDKNGKPLAKIEFNRGL